MAISVTENGNVYDIRGLAADKATIDTSTLHTGTTFFEVDGNNEVYIWTGSTWKLI